MQIVEVVYETSMVQVRNEHAQLKFEIHLLTITLYTLNGPHICFGQSYDQSIDHSEFDLIFFKN